MKKSQFFTKKVEGEKSFNIKVDKQKDVIVFVQERVIALELV